MSPRKLSDADKSDILKLYRHQSETTSTLAARYGVSNSTISRILKSSLLEAEYEALIQQKRLSRTSSSASPGDTSAIELPKEQQTEPLPPPIPRTEPPQEFDSESSDSATAEQRRKRRRSSITGKEVPQPKPNAIQTELPLEMRAEQSEEKVYAQQESVDKVERPKIRRFEELVDEDLINELDEDLDEDLDDEDLDEDLDDEDWEEDELEAQDEEPIRTSLAFRNTKVEVLPLSEASLPKICYLVVDKGSELIARPMKEFGDLGHIPEEEVQERTLPVFDNHRVARRFSNRSQRVIKVPDGQMLQKTSDHLQAKGITRLLIDGQVYSLSPAGL
ncbi:transposase [Lyngbya aestuarii]|uniref:transposase n=1 Tax=Lyngbya aestuarii TaxID=118322 RepID=UPI00403DDD33